LERLDQMDEKHDETDLTGGQSDNKEHMMLDNTDSIATDIATLLPSMATSSSSSNPSTRSATIITTTSSQSPAKSNSVMKLKTPQPSNKSQAKQDPIILLS